MSITSRLRRPFGVRAARTRRTRIRTVVVVAALATTLVAAGCSTNDDAVNADGSVDLSKVTLTVGDQAGIQQAILAASGALEGAKYQVKWAQFPAAAPLLEALRSQAVDIGYTGDAPLISALATGATISAVAVSKATAANGLAIIVPANSTIRSVADLRGKTVSPTTQGSIGHYELLSALAEAGVPAGDVKISFLDPVNAAAAFTSGSIDAWATWDPYTAVAQVDNNARIIRDAEGISSKLGILSANNQSLADKATKAAMTDFIRRFNTALTWANTHPDAYTGIYAKLTKRPTAIAALVAQRSQRVPAALDSANIAALQRVADRYQQFGVISEHVVIADHVAPISTSASSSSSAAPAP